MNGEPPKPRWWTRLLRRPFWLTALAVCLLLSALLGPFGWRYYRTRQLVAGIEAHGGRVGFKPGGPQWLRDAAGDEWMEPFAVPTEIVSPRFSGLSSGPDPIAWTVHSEDFDFFTSVVAINDIHAIKSLTCIAFEIDYNKREQVALFEHLEHLNIAGSDFDDAVAAQVSKLSALQRLTLTSTSLTDEGLRHFHGLKHLQLLILGDTEITRQGIQDLKRHLPKLEIYTD